MKLPIPITVVLIALIFTGCQKPVEFGEVLSSQDRSPFTDLSNDKYILVDASKDGGVWWFPQGAGFSEDADHQGQAFANYLRSLGFHVDELPRGEIITDQLLEKYSRIIRVAAFSLTLTVK